MQDIEKISSWFAKHPPFLDFARVVSISSGVIGEENVNCHTAYSVGSSAFSSSTNKRYGDVKVKRSEGVKLLTLETSSISKESKGVVVDPLALFNRLSLMRATDEEWKDYLKYELSPLPPSLFDTGGMHKTAKSTLYKIFQTSNNLKDFSKCHFVIDGGFLLHRIPWPLNQTYEHIYKLYMDYIERHYSKNCTVVFDGYDLEDIKQCERDRRKVALVGDIMIVDDSSVTTTKEKFISNDKNKEKFIEHLATYLNANEIATKTAKGDADVLIVSTAVKQLTKNSEEMVVVVGNDTDLLVLILMRTPTDKNIFYFKPGRGNVNNQTFSSSEIQKEYPGIQNYIEFIHAFSGCDTTSAIHNHEKMVVWKAFQKSSNQQVAATFMNENSTRDEIFSQGIKFFLEVFNSKKKNITTLNELRYDMFNAKAAVSSTFLKNLPPTDNAAKFHLLRTYAQVQIWRGKTMDASQFGWEKINGYFQPIPIAGLPAPDNLIEKVFCRCAKDCGNNCSCRKTGNQFFYLMWHFLFFYCQSCK